MKGTEQVVSEASPRGKVPKSGRLISVFAWVVALALLAFAGYLGWRAYSHNPLSLGRHALAQAAGPESEARAPAAPKEKPSEPDSLPAELPSLEGGGQEGGVLRRASLHTIIPERPSQAVITYTVEIGDSIFEIAFDHKIKPETVLWANYDQLNDNPDTISLGMVLNIPPEDGVYYQWAGGDTLEAVAARFEATPEAIVNWAANGIDLVDRQVEPGKWIFIPGGEREFRQWVIPTIARGQAGVSNFVLGPGACEGGYDGAYGSGSFIWPGPNHSLSGNDYWSGHLGIDIAAGEGTPLSAADSGVVVFAGWANGGYGNMVMIDHGNGYQTVYAHMSSVAVGCGQSVGKGGTIGFAGSTGNSTGAHLHFEVRFNGGFVSPWYVLP